MRAALALLACLATLPAQARELGTMQVSGQMTLDWIAVEPDAGGGFTARYRVFGSIDDSDGTGQEMLMAGFDLRCVGTMRVTHGRLETDEASCRLANGYGHGLWLDIRSTDQPWEAHLLRLSFGDGAGPYARVRGTGEAMRVMHAMPHYAAPWGFFNGEVRWRLE